MYHTQTERCADAYQEKEKGKRKKQNRKNHARRWSMLSIGLLFGFLIGGRMGCASSAVTDEAEPYVFEHAEASEKWIERTQDHDISRSLGIKYSDDKFGCYFGDTVATGVCHDSGIISNTETDSGFVLSVIDRDSVSVKFYNNSDDDVKPVRVTADVGGKIVTSRTARDEYIIKGYSRCRDGSGFIDMKLSNGYTLEAGVCKEKGKLYVCNSINSEYKARTIVKGSKTTVAFFEEQGLTPEDCLSTDPIYYPIVPVNKGEKTDVKPWIKQSAEIVEEDWTDAHKLYALYSWCLDNFAYDSWIIHLGEHSRWFHYNDFTGKRYFSKTHVGVCEDFSQALAIMCRAQGIPAVVVSNPNPSVNHAWNAAYIEDYDRWILLDLTKDVNMQAETEDVTAWTPFNQVTEKCKSFDLYNGCAAATEAYIGNTEDMKRYDIIQ